MCTSNMTNSSRKTFVGSIILTLSCFLLSMSMVWAGEYEILQLTENEYDDGFPQLHNGQVAWEGYDGHDWEIFLYDGAQIIQVTENEYDEYNFQLHDGQIVWEVLFPWAWEIFLYDGTQVMQLSGDEHLWIDQHPPIHNGQVTWFGWDGYDFEIFLYDGTQVIQLTEDEDDDMFPDIHNGQVAWEGLGGDYPDYYHEIFLYDGTSVIQVTEDDRGDFLPQIDNGQIVWLSNGDNYDIGFYDGVQVKMLGKKYDAWWPQLHNGKIGWIAFDGNDFEIFFYDGVKVIQLTKNEYHEWSFQLYCGQVVWEGFDGHDWEIFLYDGAQIIQLTENEYDDGSPQTHNCQVVWEGFDGHDWEIFLYDGTKVIQLTKNEYDDGFPQLHNGQVAWEGYDGHDWEIFLAVPPPVDLLVDSNNDGFVYESDDAVEESGEGFVLWANNDNDHWEVSSRYWSEDAATAQGQEGEQDSTNDTINGIHDLEDFFSMRLQIPAPAKGEKFYLEGAPIRVFKRYFVNPEDATNNIGPEQIAYLANLKTAREQHQVNMLGKVGIDSPLEIKREDFTNNVLWLIFEGVSTGGPYDLKFYREVCGVKTDEDVVKIAVKDVRDMYKFWNLRVDRVSNPLGFEIYNPDAVIEPEGDYYPANPDRMFVFLHGYNVDTNGARRWCDTMYKRLYRVGYRGGFSGITWEGDESRFVDTPISYFDRNWVNAFRTADLAEETIIRIKNEWGKGLVTVGAHSLGNMGVVSSVIKLAYQDRSDVVKKIVHLEAAVPADVYHEITNDPLDYFDGSFRTNFAVVPTAVNSYSTEDEVLRWFDRAIKWFGLSTPNYQDGAVFAPPPFGENYSIHGAMGRRPSAHDFPYKEDFYKEWVGFYDWDAYVNQKSHPYGIRDHSSMAVEYYSDVADFFTRLAEKEIR